MVEKEPFDSREVARRLRAQKIGQRISLYASVESTNDTTRLLASKGAEEGTVVLAEEQRAGRGRLTRKWHSPPGGLWFSILLRPPLEPGHLPLLTLLGGVAVVEGILETTALKGELKWPNDVLVRGKKVCGILTEASKGGEGWMVILGVGLNANLHVEDLPPEIRGTATTLLDILGRPVDRVAVLCAVLERVEDLYGGMLKDEVRGRLAVINRWKGWTGMLGKPIEVRVSKKETLQGDALDLDGDGALLLRLRDGSTRRILAGDVEILKTYYY